MAGPEIQAGFCHLPSALAFSFLLKHSFDFCPLKPSSAVNVKFSLSKTATNRVQELAHILNKVLVCEHEDLSPGSQHSSKSSVCNVRNPAQGQANPWGSWTSQPR